MHLRNSKFQTLLNPLGLQKWLTSPFSKLVLSPWAEDNTKASAQQDNTSYLSPK